MFFRVDSGTFPSQNQTTNGQGLGTSNFDNNLEDDSVPQDIMGQLGGTGSSPMMGGGQGTAGGNFGQGTGTASQNQWGSSFGGGLNQGTSGATSMSSGFNQGSYGAGTMGSGYNQGMGQSGYSYPSVMNPYQQMQPMPGMMLCCPCPMMYGQQPMPMQGTHGQTMQYQGTDNSNRQPSILPLVWYGLQGNYYNDYEDNYEDFDFDDYVEEYDYNNNDDNDYDYDYDHNDNDD
jgi:hypothetical protein